MADTVKHALRFPEGLFLLTQNDGLYFLPDGHDTAYQCYGEKKELHGKIARSMKSTNPAVKSYDIAYELDEGQLLSARLITRTTRSKGVLVDDAERDALAQRFTDGSINVRTAHGGPHLCSVSRLPDGQSLIQVRQLPGHGYETLLLGKPGAYKVLDIGTGIQGGNSFYFTLKDGTRVSLPSDFSGNVPRGEAASFGDQPLVYERLTRTEQDFVTYGLESVLPGPHLDPFSPELAKPAPAPRGPAPKGP